MVDQLVETIMRQIKEQYPGIGIPAALRAVVTSAKESGKSYQTECILHCEEPEDARGTYRCRMEQKSYVYAVRLLGNDGSELRQFPELIGIESRQQLEVGSLVQVVFLGNELEAAIVGG